MLKILAVLCIIAVSASGEPQNASGEKHSVTNQQQPTAVPTYTYDSNCCTTQAPQKSNQETRRWYTPLQDPNWWLVVVAAVTGGVVSWQSLETRRAASAARDSIRLQETGMTQWIDLRPFGLYYSMSKDSPDPPKVVTIHPQWRVFNSTPLPFTLLTIEVAVGREKGWENFGYEVEETVPPVSDGKNHFTFSAPIQLTEIETSQFLANATELSIAINVVYLGAHGVESNQSFGEFYICKPGELTINESLGKGPQSHGFEEDQSPSTLANSPDVFVMGSDEKGD